MELTLENLARRAREEGWVVSMTTNVHLDRADWPEGTGMVLVECFNEDGLPGYYRAGTDKADTVCVGGDKLNDRPHVSTVEGVLEWARYTWDSPNEPLPALFLEADDDRDWSLLEKAFEVALVESGLGAELKARTQDWMVDEGWAERRDDGQLTLTDEGMRKLGEGGGP
jgi:hypothetical protein